MPHVSASRSVLIGEEEDEVAAALSTFFEDAGSACERATDGCRVIERLERGPVPDLIVLDPALPRVDGWYVLEWLERQAPPLSQVPVVIVSSLPRAVGEPFARAHGAVGWIEKPINLEKLLGAWERLDRELGWRCADAAGSLG